MTLPATDNFNRANAGTLGANWSTTINTFQVANNAAQGNNFAYNATYWSADAFGGDHYAQCVVGVVISDGGPGVRIQSGPKSYHFDIKAGNNCKIQKDVAGSFTDLVTGINTPSTGDTVYIEASGSTITVKVNGTQVGQTTDSAITGGAAGLWSYDTSGVYDNFQADNLGGGGGGPTVTYPMLERGFRGVSRGVSVGVG